jgi:hypothetical protein
VTNRANLVLTGLTGLVVLLVAALSASAARADAEYTGFFEQRELAEAGWSTCSTLTWTVDVTGLTTRQARIEVRALKMAWATWSASAGIRVEYSGRERLAYDPSTYGLRPVGGAPRTDHHVYIAFKTTSQVPIMARNAVGLAMPTAVIPATQEITAGMTIFRRGYVVEQRRNSPDRIAHLYIHELGHVLGLGHAGSARNVMHPTLGELTRLGDGDAAGIRDITRPCPAS